MKHSTLKVIQLLKRVGLLLTEIKDGKFGNLNKGLGTQLTRHDRTSGFIFGQRNFSQPASRSRTQEPQVVGDLHQRDGDHVQSTGHLQQQLTLG